MISSEHFDCRHHKLESRSEFIDELEIELGVRFPSDYREAVLGYSGCQLKSTLTYGTGDRNASAQNLRLSALLAYAESALEARTPAPESALPSGMTVQFGFALLSRLSWLRLNSWREQLIPVGYCTAPVDGLLCFDFAFSAVDPPLVLLPMGTAFVPSQGWSLVPEFVSDSVTQLFETQVEEWDPETAQFPYEVALDAGLDSWEPSQTQLLWNGHRDEILRSSTESG